jgi:mono/diheme cytochrome c family protein
MRNIHRVGIACALAAVACIGCGDDGDDQRDASTTRDSGARDGGRVDPADAGADANRIDGGTEDDAGGLDAGATDGGTADAGTTDGGAADAGGDGAVAMARCAEDDGECIFRYETFGDEQLWTDVLRLHELVETLSPRAALGVGLKVDSEAVPADVLAAADLDDPATTVALLSLDAVVGIRATIEEGEIVSIGVACALCHSDVDDSVMPGVGRRLDGWPNRDLDTGAIIALTPGLPVLAERLGVDAAAARTALEAWGPGYYDARFNQDGESHPVLMPPAYGFRDVPLATYTGDGDISYWNAYVAVTQMGAHGNFSDPELGIDISHTPDLVTPRLEALREYQWSLEPPTPVAGLDAAAVARGRALFAGEAGCATCHSGDAFTDAPTLHAPSEVGTDPNEARRSKTGMYRTTPLRGVGHRAPYFHDGSAENLAEVVAHYETVLDISLTESEEADLIEYLRSL